MTDIELQALPTKQKALNNRPQKVTANAEIETVSWKDVLSGDITLERRSEQLATVHNHQDILNPLIETYFYSMNLDTSEYIKVTVDKDFVLWRLSTFLDVYTNTKKDVDTLVREAGAITEELRKATVKAKLEKMREDYGDDFLQALLKE